jgi:hypothetical protein
VPMYESNWQIILIILQLLYYIGSLPIYYFYNFFIYFPIKLLITSIKNYAWS